MTPSGGRFGAGFARALRLRCPRCGSDPVVARWVGMRRACLDHETIIRTLREDLQVCLDRFGDAGTGDFLTGLMERHEKMAWMLRAFLA